MSDRPQRTYKEPAKVGPGTNRAGFNSSRNKDKPFRPPRVIIKEDGTIDFHPLDMMRFGEKRLNTTGCFGFVSTYGIGHHCIVIKSGAPGKERSGRKKKSGGRLYYGTPWIDHRDSTFYKLKGFRDRIETLQIIGCLTRRQLVSDKIAHLKEHIDYHLSLIGTKEQLNEMERRDLARIASLKGQIAKGKFWTDGLYLNNTSMEINRILYSMGGGYDGKLRPKNNRRKMYKQAAKEMKFGSNNRVNIKYPKSMTLPYRT